MTNQDVGRGAPRGRSRELKDVASDTLAKVSDVAREASSSAKQVASETASSMTAQVKSLVDGQIASGVSLAGAFASSINLAAEDLNRQSPILAGLVRNFADKVEEYADEFEGQSVDQIAKTASDFTRRQPALVFGLAAVAGFFLFRTLKSGSEDNSPPLQPTNADDHGMDHG